MSYASEVLADAPLLYWKLEDAAFAGSGIVADATGNGRTGALSDGSKLGDPAIFPNVAKSLKLGGQTVQRAVDVAMNVGTGPFTFEFILKATGTSNYRAICGRSDSSGNEAHGVLTTTGTGTARLYVASGTASIIGTKNLLDGLSHHVVACRRAGQAFLYVDGAADGGPVTVGTDTNWGTVMNVETIGQSGDYPPPVGDIGHFAYYNTGLTAARALAHYTALLTADAPSHWGRRLT